MDRLALGLTLMHVGSSTLIVLRGALVRQSCLLACCLLLTAASPVIDDVDLVADDYTGMRRSSVDRLLVVRKLRVCTGFYRLVLM